jgi:hypothetical protein
MLFLTKRYSNDQIREGRLGGVCDICLRVERCIWDCDG